jgi:hypothetical protein
MGQFKPMVKMMTTEPTVELKLKKGGAVSMKKGGSTTAAKKMQMSGTMGALGGARSQMQPNPPDITGTSPARPAMADRQSSMRRMADMGARGMPSRNMGALGKMAAMGKKEGGETSSMHKAEMKKMSGTAAELKQHKSMPASKAHKGLATGGVALGQGGYKKGGKAMKYAAGGIIKSTTGETKVVTATADHSPAKTGGVKLGNGGGYKTGGVAKSNGGGYKTGGASKKMAMGGQSMPVRNSQVRPATPMATSMPGATRQMRTQPKPMNTSVPVSPTSTVTARIGTGDGGVREPFKPMVSAVPPPSRVAAPMKTDGSYKKGGASKKFARGGSVNDSGKAEAMPQGHKKPSAPVSINALSGTFKKGGKVKKMAEGGDAQQKANAEGYKNWEKDERKFNEGLRSDVEDAMTYPIRKGKELFDKVKGSKFVKEAGEFADEYGDLYMKGLGLRSQNAPGPRAVTKTKESVTVSKKRGGGAC